MFVKTMQTLLAITGKFENLRVVGSSQCAELVSGGLMARYFGPFCTGFMLLTKRVQEIMNGKPGPTIFL